MDRAEQTERFRFDEVSAGRKTTSIRLAGVAGLVVVLIGIIAFFVILDRANVWWALLSLIATFVLATLLFAVSSIGKHLMDAKRHLRYLERRLPEA